MNGQQPQEQALKIDIYGVSVSRFAETKGRLIQRTKRPPRIWVTFVFFDVVKPHESTLLAHTQLHTKANERTLEHLICWGSENSLPLPVSCLSLISSGVDSSHLRLPKATLSRFCLRVKLSSFCPRVFKMYCFQTFHLVNLAQWQIYSH